MLRAEGLHQGAEARQETRRCKDESKRPGRDLRLETILRGLDGTQPFLVTVNRQQDIVLRPAPRAGVQDQDRPRRLRRRSARHQRDQSFQRLPGHRSPDDAAQLPGHGKSQRGDRRQTPRRRHPDRAAKQLRILRAQDAGRPPRGRRRCGQRARLRARAREHHDRRRQAARDRRPHRLARKRARTPTSPSTTAIRSNIPRTAWALSSTARSSPTAHTEPWKSSSVKTPTPAGDPRALARSSRVTCARNLNCVLGLATGRTPSAALPGAHPDAPGGETGFQPRHGLQPGRIRRPARARHDQSYKYFMRENFFRHINIDPANTHIPDGTAPDLHSECRAYEERIAAAGGIDLQLLGARPQMATSASMSPPVHCARAHGSRSFPRSKPLQDNSDVFGSRSAMPRHAITMGIGTILDARRCRAAGVRPAQGARRRAHDRGPARRDLPRLRASSCTRAPPLSSTKRPLPRCSSPTTTAGSTLVNKLPSQRYD